MTNHETIQLLADGQLSHDQRSRFLDSISDDPGQWRELALAFVENQVLNEALHENAQVNRIHRSQKADIVNMQQADASPARRMSWLAVAASLAVGLLTGFLLFSGQSPESVSGSSPRPEVGTDTAVEVPDSIPLEEALARSARPVSLDARRELLRAGYFVDETRQVADVELPTGKLIQMPVREFKIHYLGNAAFQ